MNDKNNQNQSPKITNTDLSPFILFHYFCAFFLCLVIHLSSFLFSQKLFGKTPVSQLFLLSSYLNFPFFLHRVTDFQKIYRNMYKDKYRNVFIKSNNPTLKSI